MPDKKTQKKPVTQLLGNIKSSFSTIGQQILPRLGYLYILLLVCAAAYVVSIVNQTFDLSNSSITTTVKPPQGAQDANSTDFTFSFDNATVAKVKALSSGSSNLSVSLPSGRINPFGE